MSRSASCRVSLLKSRLSLCSMVEQCACAASETLTSVNTRDGVAECGRAAAGPVHARTPVTQRWRAGARLREAQQGPPCFEVKPISEGPRNWSKFLKTVSLNIFGDSPELLQFSAKPPELDPNSAGAPGTGKNPFRKCIVNSATTVRDIVEMVSRDEAELPPLLQQVTSAERNDHHQCECIRTSDSLAEVAFCAPWAALAQQPEPPGVHQLARGCTLETQLCFCR
eukprot:1973563-Prymnesium_polylepis.1